MATEDCSHEWEMINVQQGYLVVEGCFHCKARTSFFSKDSLPPGDPVRDGDHLWQQLWNYQATRFDLKCKKCGKVVDLGKVMGLMLCDGCEEDCEVARIAKENPDAWVYVALCADSTHERGPCVGDEEIQALTEYFNSRIRTPGKRVIFVPCKMRTYVDKCQGHVIADVGLTDIY